MRLTWQQIPNPTITEIMCSNKIVDGIVIDTEHGCFNNETVFSCIQVATLLKKKCFVRFTEVNKRLTRQCLDAGCTGLIYAMIENVGQCEKIKKITRYPTQGGSRGLGLVRQNQWGSDSKLIKKEPIVIAQIESLDGVKNLDDIKKSKTFNYYMIGPYDLSSSLGVPGDFNSDVYLNTVDKIKSVIRNQEMAVHIPCDIEKQLKKYENYSIIALGMDTTFLVEKIREVFEC